AEQSDGVAPARRASIDCGRTEWEYAKLLRRNFRSTNRAVQLCRNIVFATLGLGVAEPSRWASVNYGRIERKCARRHERYFRSDDEYGFRGTDDDFAARGAFSDFVAGWQGPHC